MVAIAFVLGVLIGWISFPVSHVAWRFGPISWTRAGVVGLLQIGPLRLVKMGRQWRLVATVNRELTSIIDQPACCNSPDLDEHGVCRNCETMEASDG